MHLLPTAYYVCLFRTPLCTVHVALTDTKAYVQHSTWLKLLLIRLCTVTVQDQLAFNKVNSVLGHTLHSVWFQTLITETRLQQNNMR